ncbi:MAG: hypothetical protein EOP45_02525 [Sphingobacteriaceae bacterium]|nr:MAG: hypothetical protein EOP45_02525 [Sphingobacteriaceae bacterium]
MNRNKLFFIFLFLQAVSFTVCAQKKYPYNLSSLLQANKLIIYPGKTVNRLNDGSKQGITCNGIVWLKGLDFKTGQIDLDIRGRDVFQQSFLGIAFHGIDTITYDAVYFRPFNFRSADTLRAKHTVQYVSEPTFPWDKLRQEYPLVYENKVTPAPLATEWFHARIIVDHANITVYVNNSAKPCLKVKKLNERKDGLIGLWTFGLPGDFANLFITKE